MKRSSALLCLLIILAAGCKTQEDIRRERTVETLNAEIQKTKQNTATGNNRFQVLEEQISRLTGQIEEANHSKNQTARENQNLSDRITVLEDANKKQVEYLKSLTEKVNNQSDYIAEVLESLKKISAEASTKKKVDNKPTPAPEPATFRNGYAKYTAKDYAGAKDIFVQVTNNKKASRNNRDGSLHYLGMIEFRQKNYESAKVYFSRLYSENQNSSFAPATLLQLGKTFNQLKANDEANMTYEELIAKHPNSKEAAEAKKLIK